MKKIELTQGKFALVDDEDYEYLMQWKWQYVGGYAIRWEYIEKPKKLGRPKKGEIPPGLSKRKTIKMHDFLMGIEGDREIQTDQQDRDKLNNCRYNLRVCTAKDNSRNAGKRSTEGTSKYKVVSVTRHGKYSARITFNRKTIHLGNYCIEEEAAKVYNENAILYFGDFAYLNDIKGDGEQCF